MQQRAIQSGITGRGAASARRRQRDGGYLLLAILLMMALMIITATIVAPRMVQQIKRDREEEMIHRGTEYARAIKKFYKKNGRYPTTLEELETTNQIRYLRKRYKDPLTKDGKWTLLHYGDIQNLLNTNGPGTPAAALSQQGGAAGANATGAFGSTISAGANSGFGGTHAIDGSGSPLFGQNAAQSQSTDNTGGSAGGGAALSGSTDNTGGSDTGGVGGAQPGGNGSSSSFNQGAGGSASQPGGSIFGQNTAGGNQTFGGGAIVGVASLSKDPTIRIYNKKKKYNEWQFIYNPMMDVANVLLRGPYQPTTVGGAQVGTPAGQMNGQQQGAFGQQPGGFGQQPGGLGQQSSGFGQQSGGFGQQSQSGFGQQQNTPQQNQPGGNFPPDQNQAPQ